ncbi:MAG: NUDIX hydrolase [Patescibacteria group bacterium]|jgi:8-oxo-dGTP pyrophosphatase MutT (NUDIX family)
MEFLDANGNKYKLPKGKSVNWRISVYALIIKDNKVLTVIPTWNTLFELPGGAVEKNETILEGLKRECYEETGYKINIDADIPFYLSQENFYNRMSKQFYNSIIMVFKSSLFDKKQNKSIINTADGNEISSVNWTPFKQITKSNTHRTIYPAIKKLIKIVK